MGGGSIYISACFICKTNEQILVTYDIGIPLKVVGDSFNIGPYQCCNTPTLHATQSALIGIPKITHNTEI
jgi:hypothetical protein